MNIINNNPYRLLGVYSTSNQREVVANHGKMKAFLKVGRKVSFPLDLNGLLPEVLRSEQSVADAISKLTLPTEQLRYAQFWFSKCNQLDEIACGKLTNGDIDGAIEIWKKTTASSLQNLSILGRRSSSYSSLYTSSRYDFGGLGASIYNAWVELHNSQVDSFKSVAQSAWNAIKLMDKFDMESDFKNKRYDENRRALKGLCEKLGISTSTWSGGSGSGSGCMVVIAIVVTLGILVSCL